MSRYPSHHTSAPSLYGGGGGYNANDRAAAVPAYATFPPPPPYSSGLAPSLIYRHGANKADGAFCAGWSDARGKSCSLRRRVGHRWHERGGVETLEEDIICVSTMSKGSGYNIIKGITDIIFHRYTSMSSPGCVYQNVWSSSGVLSSLAPLGSDRKGEKTNRRRPRLSCVCCNCNHRQHKQHHLPFDK